MATKIYNVKTVQASQASVGSQDTSGIYAYKGFNSRKIKQKFKEYDIDLIKQDLLNHFNIKRGEKLENPDFGTIIWSMLFEPMTEEALALIRDDVETIVNRDPRTAVESLKVDANEQGVRIEVGLLFKEYNVSEQLLVLFDKTNLPAR